MTNPKPNGTPVFLIMPCFFLGGEGFYYSRTPSLNIGRFASCLASLDQFCRKGSGTSSLSKFTAMTIEEEDEEITHEESKMLRERFFEGQHFGWCFLRCQAFSKTIDFEKKWYGTVHLVIYSWYWYLIYFKQLKLVNFETIDTCRVPYQAVYICISFPRFWLMGPIVPLIPIMGNSADNKMLDLNMECCGETQECFKMSDGEGYTRLFV